MEKTNNNYMKGHILRDLRKDDTSGYARIDHELRSNKK